MAARQQKGKGKSSGKKTAAAKKNQETSIPFLNEVLLLGILAVCILLFLSNFGLGGAAGKKVSGVFFGIFGLVAYLVPICIFVGAAFYTSNKQNRIAVVKLVAAALFVMFFCLFIELVVTGDTKAKITASYAYGVSNKNGGGIIGGALAHLLCGAFGLIGAYVVDIIVLIISLVLITERSFFGGVKKGSKKVYDTAREDAVRYREHIVQRREERALMRLDRKVEGVAVDTKIVPPVLESSDNLSELKPVKQTPQFTKNAVEKLFPGEKSSDVRQKGASSQEGRRSFQAEPSSSGSELLAFRKKSVSTGTESAISPVEPVVSRVEPVAVKTEPAGGRTTQAYSETELLLTRGEPVSVHYMPGGFQGEASVTVSKHHFDLPGTRDQDFGSCIEETANTAAAQEAMGEQEAEGAVPAFLEETMISEEASEDLISCAEPYLEESLQQYPSEEEAVSTEDLDLFEAEQEASRAMVVERVQRKPVQVQNRTELEQAEAVEVREVPKPEYLFPPTSLLKPGTDAKGDSQHHLQETALKLQQTLKNFGVNVTITDVSCGPSVTRYELQPEMGVKVSKIVNLADDIKLNLAAPDIRIEAPIPGKAAIGIEVPNKETVMVRFRDMVEAEEFKNHASSICFTAGKDIAGQVVVADIAKMPHLLIAGATGSGKSVCINTIIMSILYKANPEDVKLILIDPKVVELSVYNGIPHLFIPVVTDPKKAAGALHWAVAEMTERYQKFAEYQVRDLKGYNQKVAAIQDVEDETKPAKLPQIVIVVDELADLMMVAAGEVEDAICRLAQLARAAGIHMIIATQRPSVDVITGLIKANMPSRIAFSVSSGVDSRTILDMNGAEKLLGNGDMLFYPQGIQKPIRVQGPFVSDTEVETVVDFLKKQSTAAYNTEIEEKMKSVSSQSNASGGGNERDAYFVDAGKFVIEKDKGSIGMLQRWFKIGFNRAARIMDQLEEAGVVGTEEGTKPRKILMTMEQFEEFVEESV